MEQEAGCTTHMSSKVQTKPFTLVDPKSKQRKMSRKLQWTGESQSHNVRNLRQDGQAQDEQHALEEEAAWCRHQTTIENIGEQIKEQVDR